MKGAWIIFALLIASWLQTPASMSLVSQDESQNSELTTPTTEAEKLEEVDDNETTTDAVLLEEFDGENQPIIATEEETCQDSGTECCPCDATEDATKETNEDNETLTTLAEDSDDITSPAPAEGSADTEDNDQQTTEETSKQPTEPSEEVGSSIITENPTQSSTTKAPPTFICPNAGNFPHESDCNRYYACATNTVTTGGTEKSSPPCSVTEMTCPEGTAFNTEFSQCMRDLSPCDAQQPDSFQCTQAGGFPDPNNDTSRYYWCVTHLDGSVGFHKFHVKCPNGKLFMAELGECFMDLNYLLNGGGYGPGFTSATEPDDEDLVKAEVKQWKTKEKAQMKQQKLKEKYAKKLEKELAKKASKEAKEKLKKEKEAAKLKEKAKDNSSPSYYDDYED